jgi:hypothetical protein
MAIRSGDDTARSDAHLEGRVGTPSLLWLWNFQIPADFPGCKLQDLTMPRNCGALPLGRVEIDSVVASFSEKP